jgi:hypothetical protein
MTEETHPVEIVAKLRDAHAMLNAGKDVAAVLWASSRQLADPSDPTAGARAQDQRMKSPDEPEG